MSALIENRKVFLISGAKTQTINICTDLNLRGVYEYVFRIPLARSVNEANVNAHSTISAAAKWLLERGATRDKSREDRIHTLEQAARRPDALGDAHALLTPAAMSRPTALALAEMVAGRVHPFRPAKLLPSRSEWFTTGPGQLIVVVDQDAPQPAVDRAFAYSLAWQRDDDLILVLSKRQARAVLYRLPWIGTSVDVWTVGENGEPELAEKLCRNEVLAAAKRWPVHRAADHDLGSIGAWVAALTDAADQNPALVPAHRASYRAWQCAGRLVLKVQRNKRGVLVAAGVQYGEAKDGQRSPYLEHITQLLLPSQRTRIDKVIADAIADRLNGIDDANLEHRMQAELARDQMPGLRLVGRPLREYPAWRPMERRGFIDFLDIDSHNRLHVVETKVGSDGTLVLQALDYLIWITANSADIRAQLGWPISLVESAVEMDLVLASKGSAPGLGPYTAGQLEALANDVSWQVFLVADAKAPTLEPIALSRSAIHDPVPGSVAKPVRPPRSAGRS
jgi:hypothetical protein